ncbi:MAG: methyltransferase domain-containing protein, partial [Cytophagaceae bacterium]
MSNPIDPRDSYSPIRRAFRQFVHWASYTFILSSKRTRHLTIGDLELTVPPTVFHPGVFVTSRMFANYLRCLNLHGRVAAEVGTGSGILALSAACAGARKVVALDINPAAVEAARANAQANGLAGVVEARVSDLFSAIGPDERFDLIISSPPSFSGEPRDIADRAWHAGDGYRYLKSLFFDAFNKLHANGEMLLLLSSDTNIALMERWGTQAGFRWRQLAKRSIGVESFILFLLSKGNPIGTKT